ncbi:MAG: carboxypeptidase-like regulatory domain-containing protein, partial [Prevotella sp.]|nr:carboxypeptidase-like regulatory domain-containing protein [Prevotella sp.]
MTLFMGMLSVIAQNTNSVSGRVIDKQSKEAMEKSTLQLYQVTTARNGVKDTTFISGTFSNDLGYFTFNSVKKGNYLLKVSYLGYQELYQSLTKASGVPLSLGDIALEPDAIQIDEAVVTANVPKMVIKDDTVVYNADAFRVPEGSVIEALVEALPGAKIDDNGGITINGKTVKKFKMDGRDYMTGNNDAVMKNLPSYVIDKVKAYDEKSDLSRLTGVDDGNDDFVLEFV